MTLKELSQLYYLKREIERDRERLAALKSQLSSPTTPNLSGMPISGTRDNMFEKRMAEIVDLEAIIDAKIVQIIHERCRMERYIADIPDSLTRQIFKYRFVDFLSWAAVARRVGGGNTEEGVKKRCYRFIRAEKTEKE